MSTLSIQTFKAYSLGHVESAKSSENGRLRREKCQVTKRMQILKMVELADFADSNAKRVRRVRMLLFSRAN